MVPDRVEVAAEADATSESAGLDRRMRTKFFRYALAGRLGEPEVVEQFLGGARL